VTELTPEAIGGFLVALARTGGLVATAPVIGDPTTPVRARLIAAVSFAIVVAPVRGDVAPADVPAAALLELATGIVIGLTARLVMSRVVVAGQLIGLSLGLGFASEYDPRAAESASSVRALIAAIAALAFVSAGGFEAIARGAVSGADPASTPLLAGAVIDRAASAFGDGLALAMPIIVAALVGNLGLALMSRAAPAINVFSISLAAILIVGGLALWLAGPTIVGGIADTAREASDVLGTR
jgi:flagellar biosynthetic protein FliR